MVAGILFGLLAYKPQFGLMIPLVLLATGRWRTVFAAAATVAALALAVTLAFGIETWRAFFALRRIHAPGAREGGPGWHKIQSVFSCGRACGAGRSCSPMRCRARDARHRGRAGLAMALAGGFALKAAALCLATMLATPYSLDYDMMVLAPAIAFLAVDGIAARLCPYDKTALAALWLVPLVARSVAQATLIPLGVDRDAGTPGAGHATRAP